MMVSTRFSYLLTKDYDDHVNNELWGTSHNYSQNFVESCIESNGELIGEFITKDHYENEIREIDKTNFLSDEEKINSLNMMMMMKIMRDPMTQTIVITLLKKVTLSKINGGWDGMIQLSRILPWYKNHQY